MANTGVAAHRFGTVREVHEDGTATVVLDRPDTDEGTDDGSRSGNGDWYTLKGSPTRCPCGHESEYLCEGAHPHRVIVWPQEDDPNLIKVARSFELKGQTVGVVPYEQSFGPCISYYALTPS